jgi:hypothetical protein
MNEPLTSCSIETSVVRNKKQFAQQTYHTPEKNTEGHYIVSQALVEKGNYTVTIYINRKQTLIYKVFVQ